MSCDRAIGVLAIEKMRVQEENDNDRYVTGTAPGDERYNERLDYLMNEIRKAQSVPAGNTRSEP